MTLLRVRNKESFLNDFLIPISKVNNTCILQVNKDGFTSLLNSQDQTIILFGEYLEPIIGIDNLKLNLPDVNRFIKILSCIDSEDIELKIESNNIKYSSKTIRFTYHLLHDGIIPPCQLNPDKIKALKYQTSFSLTPASLAAAVKGSVFTTDTSKIYFSVEEGHVYGELTDKQRANVDSFRIKVADAFTGDTIKDELPLNFDIIRNIASCQSPNGADVLINHEKGVITFKVSHDNSNLMYIASGLTG